MAQFTRDLEEPSGHIAQFGDCDNGRFLKLHPSYKTNNGQLEEDQLDHRHLLSAISGLFDEPNECQHVDSYVVRCLTKGARHGSESVPMSFQKGSISQVTESVDKLAFVPNDLRKELRVTAYEHFGIFLYKSPRLYLAIRCGRGDVNHIGNHAHNDNLSFELALDGYPLITDPGTYVYTPLPHMRNLFRSTAMHNTLLVDAMEQNEWKEGRDGLFLLRDRSNPRVIACDPTYFAGEHWGYGSSHRREIRITQNGIHGRDHCEAKGLKKVFFHVPPSVKVVPSSHTVGNELISGSHRYMLSSAAGEWSIAASYHSTGYGSLTPTHVICLQTLSDTVEWAIEA